MILFTCPNCDRHYEVPNALRHLPLICKGCGQHLDVPEPIPEIRPAAESILTAKVAEGIRHAHREATVVTIPDASERITATRFEAQAEASTSERASEEPEANIWFRAIGIGVDIAVCAASLAIGIALGEELVGKPSLDVLKQAAVATKFPTVDLTMWLAIPAALLASYALLISRSMSLGSCFAKRLTRRSAKR